MKQNGKILANLLIPCILIIIFFISVLATNIKAPLYADDYLYAFKFNPGFVFQDPSQLTYEPIRNITDYFQSLQSLYKSLTGRLVAHGMLQFMLLLNRHVFDIMNAIALFLLCYLMMKFVIGSNNKLWLYYLVITFSLFYIAVSHTVSNLYISAFSCNYIWTQVIILSFLYPFRKHMEDDKSHQGSISFAAIMFFAGLITGDTNEPVIPGVLMFICLYWIYCKIMKKHQPLWMSTAFLGLFLGYLFMFFAPGNSQRSLYEATASTKSTGISIHFENIRQIILLSIASIPAFIIGLLALLRLKKSQGLNEWLIPASVLVILSGTLLGMLFVPIMVHRLNILFVGFYLMIVLSLVRMSKLDRPKILLIITILILPIVAGKIISDYSRMSFAAKEYTQFDKEIANHKGDSVLVNPRAYLDPISRENWAKPIATYYGLKSVWVHDEMDSTYLSKARSATFERQDIIFSNQSDKPDLKMIRYNNITPYARMVYISLKMDTQKYDPSMLKIKYYTLDLPSFVLIRIFEKLPQRIRLLCMTQEPEFRDNPYGTTDNITEYAISSRNRSHSLDYVRIRILYKDQKIEDILLKNVEFR